MAAKLFAPLRLRDLELPNRIAVSPVCQYRAEDGGFIPEPIETARAHG